MTSSLKSLVSGFIQSRRTQQSSTHTRQSFISRSHSHQYYVCKLNKSACLGENTEEVEWACTRQDKRGQERVKACDCANEAGRCKNNIWEVIPPHRHKSHSFTNRGMVNWTEGTTVSLQRTWWKTAGTFYITSSWSEHDLCAFQEVAAWIIRYEQTLGHEKDRTKSVFHPTWIYKLSRLENVTTAFCRSV